MNDTRRRFGLHVWIITPLHEPGEHVFHVGTGRGHTRCGRRTTGALLHADHAARFARPCRQCWPIQQLELPGLDARRAA